jgi:hypothetical protein
MLDAKELRTILQKMGPGHAGEIRRGAEQRLESVTAELLDAKVRYSMSATSELRELKDAVLADTGALSAAGAVVLDRFRYRLAHVAMRNQQWNLASALLDAVLEGSGELTRARLYRTVCTLRDSGRIDDDALRKLVHRYRQEGMERPGAPALDVLVQEPTTCLLELLLLCQGGEPQLLDQLYDTGGRQRTIGLSLFIKPKNGRSSTPVLSEWLAHAHLEEWGQEGWLVIDTTVERIGEPGRGSRLHGTNVTPRALYAVAQLLAEVPLSANTLLDKGMETDAVKVKFEHRYKGRLGRRDDWRDSEDWWETLRERVQSARLDDHPDRKLIRRESLENAWYLVPPYVVVQRDSVTALRQAAGNFQ